MEEWSMYQGFAQVYDMFMDNVPYESWRDYLVKELKKEGITDGLILDLGCGTGKMTRLLADEGYDMIGVDISEDMLMIAREAEYYENIEEAAADMEQVEKKRRDILYLLQDMREFELYGTVRAVISVCDSMNYILEPDELRQVFSLVNNYLDPQGIFLFDLNTIYKYERLLADNSFCENRKEGSFIWENYYDRKTRINQYDLTLFIEEPDYDESEDMDTGLEDESVDNYTEDVGGLYRKYEETHFQRAYTLDEIKQLLEEAGLQFIGAYDVEDGNSAREDSAKLYIIAKECQKGEK